MPNTQPALVAFPARGRVRFELAYTEPSRFPAAPPISSRAWRSHRCMSPAPPCLFADPLPPAFRRRVVSIEPRGEVPYVAADWDDALVVVERGELEVEGRCGGRRRFVRGDVLWLAGLPLTLLRNPGAEPAVIAAVSRRGAGDSPDRRPTEDLG